MTVMHSSGTCFFCQLTGRVDNGRAGDQRRREVQMLVPSISWT